MFRGKTLSGILHEQRGEEIHKAALALHRAKARRRGHARAQRSLSRWLYWYYMRSARRLFNGE